jgi:hypothetical protein
MPSFRAGLIARSAMADTTPPNTLRALPGAFALNGEDMTTLTALTMPAGTGGFALAGQSATLTPPVAAYTGPGDINGAAVAWYGLRGFNAAYCTGSQPAIDVVDAATGAIQTVINITTAGKLDTAAITALGYAVRVKKLYDQSGNGRHVSQANLALMPALTLNAIGTLPGMTFTSARTDKLLSSATVTQAQKFTVSVVAKRTAVNSNDGIFYSSAIGFAVMFGATSGNMALYAGAGGILTPATENAFHAAQGLFDAANSVMYIDGVLGAAANPGTTGASGENLCVGTGVSGGTSGVILEAGLWAGDKSANNAAMNTNQHGTNGWNF